MRKVLERIYRHPIPHAYAVVVGAQGVALLPPDKVLPGGWLSSTLGVTTLGLLAIIASVLILTGLQWRGSSLISYAVEKVGHIFGAAVWVTQLGIVIYAVGLWNIANVTALTFFIASGVSAVKLHRMGKSRVVESRQRIRDGGI